MVEDHNAEEDTGPRSSGEKEVQSSVEEEAGMTGEVSDVDSS